MTTGSKNRLKFYQHKKKIICTIQKKYKTIKTVSHFVHQIQTSKNK